MPEEIQLEQQGGSEAAIAAPVVPIQNEAAATTEAAATSPYREVASIFGLETDNIDDIKGHWGKVQGDLESKTKQLSEYEGKIKGMSPMLLAVQEELAKEGFAGTDAEILKRIHEKSGQALMDYGAMITDDPRKVLVAGNMLTMGLTEKQASLLARNEEHALKKSIEEQNPEATEDEIAAEVNEMLGIKAKAHLKALEDSKPKFGVRPEGIESPEQVQQRQASEAKVANENFVKAVTSFTGLDLGESGKWDVKLMTDDGKGIRPEYAEIVQKVADPNTFFRQFLDADGRYNPAAALKFMVAISDLPKLASAKAAEARGQALKAQQDQMQNINGANGGDKAGANGILRPLTEVYKGPFARS